MSRKPHSEVFGPGDTRPIAIDFDSCFQLHTGLVEPAGIHRAPRVAVIPRCYWLCSRRRRLPAAGQWEAPRRGWRAGGSPCVCLCLGRRHRWKGGCRFDVECEFRAITIASFMMAIANFGMIVVQRRATCTISQSTAHNRYPDRVSPEPSSPPTVPPRAAAAATTIPRGLRSPQRHPNRTPAVPCVCARHFCPTASRPFTRCKGADMGLAHGKKAKGANGNQGRIRA
jgi:hypothetical protein